MKRPALQNKQVVLLRMAFRARKVLGYFEKRALGYWVYRGSQGMLLGALKLAYRSGHVWCVSNVAHDSLRGCHGYSSLRSYPLNVVITDKYNNVIFPLNQSLNHFIKHSAGLWYNMPAVDENHTDELVFSNFEYPLYLSPFMELRIWFGEDLKNWSRRG